MENRFEDEFGDQKRERFDKVSEKEQIQRFVDLKSLFADKKKLTGEEDKEKIKRANYFDFIKNAYKYPDEVKIEGVENSMHYSQLFSQAEYGNKLIKEVLNIFLDFQQSDNKPDFEHNLQSTEQLTKALFDTSFLKKENNQVLLDVEKLKKMFRWCLVAFVEKGKSIGREPANINEKDIDKLCDDLEDIINQMNSMFIKSKTLDSIV